MKTTLTDGSPVTDDHRELKENGQQKGYVVLSEEERAKGFVRPVRHSYQHVGDGGPKNPLRNLTPEEIEWYGDEKYVKYEEYPASQSPAIGRFWKADELALKNGCGVVTKMGGSLAETYARQPSFYGATFCCGCGKHFPVDQFVWDGTTERVGS